MSVFTPSYRSSTSAAALGAAVGVAAALLQWLVHPLVGSHMPFAFFLPALAFSAASLGRLPACIVLFIGAANAALLAPPVGSFAIANSQDVAGVVIYGILGTLLVFYGGHLRITTRRAALAEKHLALAQDETGVGVFELDFRSGTAYVSPSLCRMLGQRVTAEPIGLEEWLGALGAGNVADATRAIQERFSRGEMRYEREQRIELPGGRVVWLLNRVQLEATPDGVLAQARGAAVDITERKKANDELMAAQEKLRVTDRRFSVALESSIVPFSIITPVRGGDGRIIDFEWGYINPAAARALGRRDRELLGRRIGESLPRAWEPPGQFDRYVRVVETGEPSQFEVCTQATNQGVRWYGVVASELQGSVAVWFANITDRKLNEQALEAAAKRKDEFLATLAHELRNPLGAIRQGVQIARAIASTETQKRLGYAVIDRQVTQMSLLLDDLLDVARVGRGTLLLRKSREVLAELVDTAIETARPHIEAKHHHLQVDLPRSRIVLEVDPLRMTQVIGNLLVNAAKYTDAGGRIRLNADLVAGGLEIRVADNGIGLTKEQIDQVFDMFTQIPAALERSQGGLGIGLALARGLIELHDGNISASSPGPGQGSEFIVRLPQSCVKVQDAAAAPPASAAQAQRKAATILIADDNRDAADSLAELLRLHGHQVHVAYDGEEAMQAFSRIGPDAALLDLDMPRVSGIELARAFRQRPAGLAAVLIAITGHGQERDREMALGAGFDHHVTKPISPERILSLIESGLVARTPASIGSR
jgi:PAS domain S-box-containing protein